MRSNWTLDRATRSAKPHRRWCAVGVALAALASVPATAHAVDGCLVLLCLAAPNWRAIPECLPPVKQLFRDLAKGKAFPSCGMSGSGNSASNAWAVAPTFCPPQYTQLIIGESGALYRCEYVGAISVSIDGLAFSRTWWKFDGDAVTDFSPAARTRLGVWDTRFDSDYAKWLESVSP